MPVWTTTQKWTFRFFFCFFVLYVCPFPLNETADWGALGGWTKWLYGASDWLSGVYRDGLHAIGVWTGAHVLKLGTPITVFENGSGDTTYNYVIYLVLLVFAVVGTVAWGIADRRRRNYEAMYYWLRVIVRYYLGYMMVLYGLYKIYHLQMPSPFLYQLVQPFGYKSPMGLAWSFVGYSAGFSAFTGWGELVGGVLLFFRRTTTLGAVILVPVLVNVVAINFSFDVPVKLFSSTLLLMTLFLLAPDMPRLWKVLLGRQTTEPRREKAALPSRWLRRTRRVIKPIALVLTLLALLEPVLNYVAKSKYKGARPHYYGIYNVTAWTRNGQDVPLLITDSARWKRMTVDFDGFATVFYTNDSMKTYVFKPDSAFSHITLYPRGDTAQKALMDIRQDSLGLALSGIMSGDTVSIRLLKLDENRFLLVNRGFHWVNEYPLNR